MSEILKRLAEMDSLLSKRLYGNRALTKDEADEVIRRHTMLVAREAWVDSATTYKGPYALSGGPVVLAKQRFPLPPKRVLREEPDPHINGLIWKYKGGHLLLTYTADGVWRLPGQADPVYSAPTTERIDLWHSLKHNPYREVPDNGDE